MVFKPCKRILFQRYFFKNFNSNEYVKTKRCFYGKLCALWIQKSESDKHKLVIDEAASEIVRRIFRLKTTGKGFAAIARLLTSEGVSSPSLYQCTKEIKATQTNANENPWNMQTVKKILQNPVYLRHMVQGSKCSSKSKITVMNTHEPIIEKSLFEQAQGVIQERRSIYYESHGKYDGFEKTENTFKGYLYCGCCGNRLSRYKEVYGNGNKMLYVYICSKHEKSRNEVCGNSCRVHEMMLFEDILGKIKEHINTVMKSEAFKTSKKIQSYKQLVVKKVCNLENAEKEIDNLRLFTFERFAMKEISADVYRTEINAINNKRNDTQKQISTLRTEYAYLEQIKTLDSMRRKVLALYIKIEQ